MEQAPVTPRPARSPRDQKVPDFDEVLSEELRTIRDRRAYLRFGQQFGSDEGRASPADAQPERPPSAGPAPAALQIDSQVLRTQALKMGLTGLAFSGGGIRSATFAIGVLQGLAELNLLSRFDYLSTVSGGGYTGAWFAAWIKRDKGLANVELQLRCARVEQAKADRQLLRPRQIVEEEPEPVYHVRSYSNYLAPRLGIFSADTWSGIAIYLRNFLINLLTILPATIGLIVILRLVVLYFNITRGDYAQYASALVAIISLALSVTLLNRELNLIGDRRRDDSGMPADHGSGAEDVRARRMTRSGLHVLTILPLFLAAITLTWLFKPTGEKPSFDEIPFLKIIFPPLVRFPDVGVGTIAVAVAIVVICGVVASLFFWVTHRKHKRWQEARWRAWQVSFWIGLIFGLVLVSVAYLFVYEDLPWSDQTLLATWIGILIAIQVGAINYIIHFQRIVRVLLAWEGNLSGIDSFTYWARMTLVPMLAAFGGGFIYILATEKLSWPLKDRPWDIAMLGPSLFFIGGGAMAVLNVGLLGQCLGESEREWWAYLSGALMKYALVWLALFGIVVYGVYGLYVIPDHRDRIVAGLCVAWAMISQGGARAAHYEEGGAAAGGPISRVTRKILPVVAPPVFLVGLLVLVAWLVALWFQGSNSEMTASERYLDGFRATEACTLVCWFGGSAVAVLLAICLINVNMFSMNAMYANRLVRCYLGASRRKKSWRVRWQDGGWFGCAGAPTGDGGLTERDENEITGFDPEDDLPLRQLLFGSTEAGSGRITGSPRPSRSYDGPFHLINTALNLVAGQELAWQDRKADSFVLTPLYCGSRSTGYRRLPHPEDDPDPDLTLGRAIAISGAAADPNMAAGQSPPQTMLMTVFNARLGRWLENPRSVTSWMTVFNARLGRWLHFPRSVTSWSGGGPSTGGLLFRELFGLTDSESRYVHLSDGGHFENLGVYELVRRRCRFIVACDAGQDGGITFEDLAGLIRKCRADFGVRIEIDISPIRTKAPSRTSRWHCAVGSIRYDDVDPDAPPGVLVYLKSSLTGDEPTDVQNYAALNPDFPHQSTADQFFDADQFESYRALGHHITYEVFFEAIADEAEWHWNRENRILFSQVRRRWFPPPPDIETNYKEATRAFSELQTKLRSDENLRELSRELYPELLIDDSEGSADAVAAHSQSDGNGPVAMPDAPTDPDDAGPANSSGSPGRRGADHPGGRPSLASPADRRTAELHAVNEILIAMESAWLGVKLEGYPEHPMNRGYLNTFRRCSGSRIIHKHWPTVRSGLDQEFVQFCERELKLPSHRPDVKAYDEVRDMVSPAVLNDMAAEFVREWPEERRTLKSYISASKSAGGPPPAEKTDSYHTWLVLRGGDVGQNPFVLGLIAMSEAPKDGAHELFVWIRGAYRNVGIGRRCVEQVYDELRRLLTTGAHVRVRYEPENFLAQHLVSSSV